MCTVTFIPLKDKYIITSNRDEKYTREKAIVPAVYSIGKNKILFPKDSNAGGTWIALHENGNAIVLLNGAFESHTPQPPYDKSRGIILLEIIKASSPVNFFKQMNLAAIEPFTVIVFDDNKLYESRWDGNKKYCRQLIKSSQYIWSSSTLYSKETAAQREQWFSGFLKKYPHPTQEDILQFHQLAGNGDVQNNLTIERKGIVSTVSITSIAIGNETGTMKYLDLKENQVSEKRIKFLYTLQDEAIN